ncbi:MAG: Holliday junction branch migration protein RuvA [Eggerthellaceae bacterium]|nr:Holliday junction branch migration protein RuvA [Eggerthellaceae bacterium]
MIAFLEGVIAGKTLASVYLNVGGVGFEVGMSQAGLSKLPQVGEQVLVHTYLQVRDDGMSLFGFLSLEEKALFEKLITVSGVGPKVALAALSSYTPSELATLIAAQDIAAVQRIPGVGKKTASRIVLELKGSLDQGIGSLFAEDEQVVSKAVEGAREALLSMGFTSAEADLALKGAPEDGTESTLLQYALKKLGA